MLIGIDASRATAEQRTGTENYSLYLIRALLDRGRSHRFRLYFNQPPAEGLFVRDERVTWRVMSFPRLWTHIRLAWEIARYPPDILFVPAHAIPWIHAVPCIATVHDLGYLYYPKAHTRFSRWYLDWSTRHNARASQRVIVDSNTTRQDLIDLYGTDPPKIVVAYPAGSEGFAPATDPVTLETVQNRYGTGSRYFLHVGTLHPRKNLDTLIRAFAVLVDQGTIAGDVKLVLTGRRGWLYEEIAELVQSPSLLNKVVLPGYVPTEDLPALLSGALAYILPSWYEGFGLPILEAMACDVPVICSNVASLPEVAGDAALLIDPSDQNGLGEAMARVYSEQDLRQELIVRGRQQIRRFSWQRCADAVLATLESVGCDRNHER
jgi:glycosyltransferase involved in cell wall biosynthesis